MLNGLLFFFFVGYIIKSHFGFLTGKILFGESNECVTHLSGILVLFVNCFPYNNELLTYHSGLVGPALLRSADRRGM